MVCMKRLMNHASIVFHDADDHFSDFLVIDLGLGLAGALEFERRDQST